MKTLIEKIVGVNWRSTISGAATAIMGLLAALAAAPYTLGDISMLFPPEWKAKIFTVSIIAAALLKVINSMVTKDRAVSGNKASGFEVAKGNDEIKVIPSSSPDLTVVMEPPVPVTQSEPKE